MDLGEDQELDNGIDLGVDWPLLVKVRSFNKGSACKLGVLYTFTSIFLKHCLSITL